MPNLVGMRDGPSPLSVEDQAKQDTLVAIQMEALGLQRRDLLSTTDFKENKASYIPTKLLESQRIVNKGNISKGEKSKLDGWNNAWTGLQDDGTDAQNLRAVNEGLGQTHRAKLMNDGSIRNYTGEYTFQRGGRDIRGGRGDRGGRGGGYVGRGSGRGGGGKDKGVRRVTFQSEILVQPVTRVRVLKGNSTPQSDSSRRQPIPILKTAPAVKPPKQNTTTLSAPAASIRRTVPYEGWIAEPSTFMASSGIRKEQNRDEATIKIAPSAVNVSKDKPPKHVDSAMKISNEKVVARKSNAITDSSSVKTTTTADKPTTVSVSSRSKADLMDLDIDQETTQPVLQFTAAKVEEPAHRVLKAPLSFDQQIEALIESGKLSPNQQEELRLFQGKVHATKNENTLVSQSDTPHPETHTKSELVSLPPKAAAPKVTTSIARKLEEQQDTFLIGEHVHKTRYHAAATSLTEDFGRLTISDKKPVEATAASLPNIENPDRKPISVEKGKSKTNPFGPPPDKGKGPSLPPHLLAKSTTADHGAAARAQYSGIGAAADKGKDPSLPPHLLAQSTTADRGAAARNQYSGIAPTSDNGSDPSRPAQLLAQSTAKEHGPAARDLYSGVNAILSSISNQQSSEDVTSSVRPTRRNKINQTGFIALAENRVSTVTATGQKGEDPLLVARTRGL